MITKQTLIDTALDPNNHLSTYPLSFTKLITEELVQMQGLKTRHNLTDFCMHVYKQGSQILAIYDKTESNFIFLSHVAGIARQAIGKIIQRDNPDKVLYLFPRKDNILIYDLKASRIVRDIDPADYPNLIEKDYCTVLTDYHLI